jgi:hypothetical protein
VVADESSFLLLAFSFFAFYIKGSFSLHFVLVFWVTLAVSSSCCVVAHQSHVKDTATCGGGFVAQLPLMASCASCRQHPSGIIGRRLATLSASRGLLSTDYITFTPSLFVLVIHF